MSALKALSIRQPWIGQICAGQKHYETRSWRTNRRGWIALHASKRPQIGTGPTGVILAIARLVNVVPVEALRGTLSAQELANGDYRDGRFAWHLQDVRVLTTPIPHHGGLSFWAVDPHIALAIVAELQIERS